MSLKLKSGDYERIRKEANKAQEIKNPDPKKLKAGKRGSGVNYIPPLNANIKYSFLPKIDKKFTAKLRADDVPEYYNVKDKLGENTTPVPDQKRCGSCWAFAVAGVLNDNFALKYGKNPNLSPSYILSFFSDGNEIGAGCDGGNPGGVVNLLNQYPVLTNNCMDYSWCETNGNCSGDATKHFEKDEKFNKNSLIPTPGCYVNDLARNGYFIKDSKVFGTTDPNEAGMIQLGAKKWLMDKGSLIGCFPIFDTFLPGNFDRTEGIYVESVNYAGSGFVQDYPAGMTNHLQGFHAITVIGFGKSKTKIRYLDGNGTEHEDYIQYWIGRNSWNTNWGDEGYFKIAMYPVNSCLTFELIQDGMGGLIGVEVSDIEKVEGIDKALCNGADCPKTITKPADFYEQDGVLPPPQGDEDILKTDEKDEKDGDAIQFETRNTSHTLRWIIFVGLIGGIIYLLVRNNKSEGKSKNYRP